MHRDDGATMMMTTDDADNGGSDEACCPSPSTRSSPTAGVGAIHGNTPSTPFKIEF